VNACTGETCSGAASVRGLIDGGVIDGAWGDRRCRGPTGWRRAFNGKRVWLSASASEWRSIGMRCHGLPVGPHRSARELKQAEHEHSSDQANFASASLASAEHHSALRNVLNVSEHHPEALSTRLCDSVRIGCHRGVSALGTPGLILLVRRLRPSKFGGSFMPLAGYPWPPC
jgi:hypothetical protein